MSQEFYTTLTPKTSLKTLSKYFHKLQKFWSQSSPRRVDGEWSQELLVSLALELALASCFKAHSLWRVTARSASTPESNSRNSKTWFTQFSPKTTFHATHHIRIVLVPNNRLHNKALHFRKYVGCFECKLFGFHFQNQNQTQAQVLLRASTDR